MAYKPLNKKHEDTIAKIREEYVVHVVNDNGDAYVTFGKLIRIRIDRNGNVTGIDPAHN